MGIHYSADSDMSVRVTAEQLKIKVKRACLWKTHAKPLLIQVEFKGTPVKDIHTEDKRWVRQNADKCKLLIKFIFVEVIGALSS